MITKQVGYRTEDGRMFASLDEACGHKYTQQLRAIVGKNTFGVQTIMEHACDIHRVLEDYVKEMATLDRAGSYEREPHDLTREPPDTKFEFGSVRVIDDD